MLEYIEYDPEDFSPIDCPDCGSIRVVIVTPAIHISSEQIGLIPSTHGELNSKYFAMNSDSSWKISESEKGHFECIDCERNWPLDGDVHWQWY